MELLSLSQHAMIDGHWPAHAAQYFNFLPWQRHFKVWIEFIDTVWCLPLPPTPAAKTPDPNTALSTFQRLCQQKQLGSLRQWRGLLYYTCSKKSTLTLKCVNTLNLFVFILHFYIEIWGLCSRQNILNSIWIELLFILICQSCRYGKISRHSGHSFNFLRHSPGNIF